MSAPYQLSASTRVIARRWFQILTDVKELLFIKDVWFGDQTVLPRTPAICVEPGVKRRSLAGVPDMTHMEIDTVFFIYHSEVSKDQQQARDDCIKFAEDVEEYLHVNHLRLLAADGTQLTIHGFCTDFDPGYSYRPRTLYNAVQMTWTNTTKVSLQRQF